MSAAPKSAAEYLADARRYDAARDAYEAAGDGIGADRCERRALLARRAAVGAAFRVIGGAQ